jgi:predicted ATPase
MAESPPLNNLPVPSTRLSGRQREIAEVGQHLCDSRLVTLTGPAGCGKTRLALAVARAVLPEFRHGVWLVELAPLAEAEWLTQTVAGALGVREEPGQSPYAPLRDHLRPRHLLMVLDGVDRLSAQCVWLADPLLADCPHLKILITSRAPLELREAVTWPVPPLSLPGVEPEGSEPLPRSDNAEEGGSGGEATGLTASDAAALFVERATVARPDFAPTPENSAAVAPLCCRLEGNPLAIELAAGWMKWLPPQQVLQELNRH